MIDRLIHLCSQMRKIARGKKVLVCAIEFTFYVVISLRENVILYNVDGVGDLLLGRCPEGSSGGRRQVGG